uniref:Uncharacterized protein n=1 Tax=Acrobeloides nanus TaxID=290746 RepID=A0A914EHU3_9BILA
MEFYDKDLGELDVGKISRASSIASIPNLESTSEFLRFTHALVDEAEELEAHGCKLDDEQRREINGLFVRTYSLISNVFKPLKHKRTSRSGLDESFGFFRIKDYNQFIEIMSLAEPGVSFYGQLDVFMEKLRIVWGDFEHVSNSTIVGTTMDLLLDLCIAIEDNLIVIDTVPEKIAKSEHEDVLQDMLKYERQNPPVSDYVTSSDVSNFYKNFLTEASTSSTNKLYIDRDEFEQYSKFVENHCDVTKLWSPNVLFSKEGDSGPPNTCAITHENTADAFFNPKGKWIVNIQNMF